MTTNKIFIVIPAYNEEKRIGKSLKDYSEFFARKKKSKEIADFKIFVVINKPQDNTGRVVKEYMKHCKEIDYLTLKQKGKGLAIRKGFEFGLKTKFDIIGFADADDSVDAENFYKLVQNLDSYNSAIASRYLPDSKMNPKHPPIRVLTAEGFNFIVRSLFFMPFKDTQCGGKIVRRKLLEKIINKLTITQWAFDIDFLYQIKKQGGKIKEVPIFWRDSWGTNIDPIRSSMQMFFAVIQLRILNSPFKKTIRFISPLIAILYNLIK